MFHFLWTSAYCSFTVCNSGERLRLQHHISVSACITSFVSVHQCQKTKQDSLEPSRPALCSNAGLYVERCGLPQETQQWLLAPAAPCKSGSIWERPIVTVNGVSGTEFFTSNSKAECPEFLWKRFTVKNGMHVPAQRCPISMEVTTAAAKVKITDWTRRRRRRQTKCN